MDDVIGRARKLLRLRDRAGTAGEAQAAARALGKLLDKHRLTVAEVELRDSASTPVLISEDPLISFGRLPKWRSALARKLCRHYGVAFWRRKYEDGANRRGHRRYRYAIHLCGRAEDIEMTRFMFTWLSAEAERLSHAECSGWGGVTHNSWRAGFVDGIAKQLRAARETVAEGKAEAALVLFGRYEAAAEHMRKRVTGLQSKTRVRRWTEDATARAAGQERGERQHLGKSLSEAV